ncbi:MAG: hypothetical protein HKN25_15560 [Pyrinomonadaceae bacterium]|nr:hypothetical protein [Pyrinomonadaceae bacterium]
MKKSAFLSITFLGLLMLCFGYEAFARSSEIEAVTVPLETYLKNHIKGDSKELGKAMHTVGKLIYVRDGNYTAVDFPRYLTGWKLRNVNVVTQTRSYIDSIEVTGDVAIGKLGLAYPGRRFTDYMTLMKIDGEWKITNKIAYSVTDPKNSVAERADLNAIRVPLENYMTGHKTGRAEYMKKAFHTEGKLMSMRSGKFTTLDFDKFIGYFKGTPAKDEALRKRWIERIDATGNVAIGKIILDYPNVKFTDYMSLMKFNGEWKIVNKAFYMERKQIAK